MRIGVLAVQGNFREHIAALGELGAEGVEVRKPEQLAGVDGLIVPGGESTAIGRLVRLYGLDDAISRFEGPLFGTCAGMILLARDAVDGVPEQPFLGLIDVVVRRNGFGRQVWSFEADVDLSGETEPFCGVFIRAPRLELAGDGVETLGRLGEEPVLLREGRVLVSAFHPELTDDMRIHRVFLEMVRGEARVEAHVRS